MCGFKIGRNKLIIFVQDVMENQYCELWKKSESANKSLINYQELLVKIMPKAQEKIPDSFDKLNKSGALSNFQYYILLSVLYAFSYRMSIIINELCRKLAKAQHDEDNNKEDMYKDLLSKTVDFIADFPFDKIVKDKITGLLRFNEYWGRYKKELETVKISLLISTFGQWSYGDIIGTITNYGLLYEDLWKDAQNHKCPNTTNIRGLLTDSEYNKTLS